MSVGLKSAMRLCGFGGFGPARCSPQVSAENWFNNFVPIRTGNGIWTKFREVQWRNPLPAVRSGSRGRGAGKLCHQAS